MWEGKYGANTVYTCMWMEKWYLLKIFQEWERIKENDGRSEFKHDVFDIL
jgi:hypothetical protein